MMRRKLGALMFFALMMLTYGCGGSDSETPEPVDSKNPEMVISKPTEGATVMRSHDLQLTGTFTDDMDLESVTVTLSFNQTKAAAGINDPWEPSGSPETIALIGKEDKLTDYNLFGEKIPFDCKVGSYLLKFDLKDKSGKTSSKQINIVIGG